MAVTFIGAHIGAPYTDAAHPAVEVIIRQIDNEFFCEGDARMDDGSDKELWWEVFAHLEERGGLKATHSDTGPAYLISAESMTQAVKVVRLALDEWTLRPTEYWFERGDALLTVAEEFDDTEGGPNYVISCNRMHCEEVALLRSTYVSWLVHNGNCTLARQWSDANGFQTYEVRLAPGAKQNLIKSLTALAERFPPTAA